MNMAVFRRTPLRSNALKEIEKKIAGKCCAEYFDFARNLPAEYKKNDLNQ